MTKKIITKTKIMMKKMTLTQRERERERERERSIKQISLTSKRADTLENPLTWPTIEN